MIYDKGITFHFLHKVDGQPLKYVKMCTKDDKMVPWNEVVRGYEVSKNDYVTFEKQSWMRQNLNRITESASANSWITSLLTQFTLTKPTL